MSSCAPWKFHRRDRPAIAAAMVFSLEANTDWALSEIKVACGQNIGRSYRG